VTSYDALASDLKHFTTDADTNADGSTGEFTRVSSAMQWHYLVLDEGHVIKNATTKAARAVRAIQAAHRLILSGTPIQNSALELWAMFDFLMPGFLGTEKQFRDKYAKPITAARDPKCDEIVRKQGEEALEALHRQVLPFILRRMKDDVLSELPPKIIQDHYCEMSAVQRKLYEHFTTQCAENGFDSVAVDGGDGGDGHDGEPGGDEDGGGNANGKRRKKNGAASHVFQALQYLRRLCSHPKLVLQRGGNGMEEVYEDVMRELRVDASLAMHDNAKDEMLLSNIALSPKLCSLRDVLLECGIGSDLDSDNTGDGGGHRALIFAQMKSMLDIVETDLFRAHMRGVSFLRLDGSVELSKRHSIVTRFNADPTIDCLLLTTHVGGLGLNLTGADTVIFLEHDWNPSKDLQAMDRAHRLGQTRTVNVFRLITRDSLEEKIMGLQRFKTHLANTVVNKNNASLQSMNTAEVLSLFKNEAASPAAPGTASDAMEVDAGVAVDGQGGAGGGGGVKAAVAELGDLWGEEQYEEEFNVDEYLAAINGQAHHQHQQQQQKPQQQ